MLIFFLGIFVFENLQFSPFSLGYDSYGVPDQNWFRTCCPAVPREHLRSPDPQGFPVHRPRWQRPGTQTHPCIQSLNGKEKSVVIKVHVCGMQAHSVKRP